MGVTTLGMCMLRPPASFSASLPNAREIAGGVRASDANLRSVELS